MATQTILRAESDWKTVWTNPDSTSAFAAQTVAIDLSYASEISVKYKTAPFDPTEVDEHRSTIGSYGSLVTYTGFYSGAPASQFKVCRRNYSVDTSGVVFEDAYVAVGVDVAANNERCIPTEIMVR